MSSVYNYSVFREKKGQVFVDNLLTRSTYFVVDPDKTSAKTTCYVHRDTSSIPLLYATTDTFAPSSSDQDAVYGISLYRGNTRTIVNSLRVTPTETTLSKNLVIPNEVYIGPSRDWKLSVNTSSKTFLFERKDYDSGTYIKEFEISNTN